MTYFFYMSLETTNLRLQPCITGATESKDFTVEPSGTLWSHYPYVATLVRRKSRLAAASSSWRTSCPGDWWARSASRTGTCPADYEAPPALTPFWTGPARGPGCVHPWCSTAVAAPGGSPTRGQPWTCTSLVSDPPRGRGMRQGESLKPTTTTQTPRASS